MMQTHCAVSEQCCILDHELEMGLQSQGSMIIQTQQQKIYAPTNYVSVPQLLTNYSQREDCNTPQLAEKYKAIYYSK